ncbi:hypothetical protein [Methylobacterium sp. J-077]|uniref:hypothetical protein n=1 Tax=Methylobacterium sp. J-077 TaxID=2836656 RepID=UPI001FB97F49|nr:hypothetical protein [Methylobacterium sp. J-077]MCJ2125316.1 hypothetical protein [Methylobacterium sp. J-077]
MIARSPIIRTTRSAASAGSCSTTPGSLRDPTRLRWRARQDWIDLYDPRDSACGVKVLYVVQCIANIDLKF